MLPEFRERLDSECLSVSLPIVDDHIKLYTKKTPEELHMTLIGAEYVQKTDDVKLKQYQVRQPSEWNIHKELNTEHVEQNASSIEDDLESAIKVLHSYALTE